MAYFLTAHCPPPHVELAPPTPVAPEIALALIESYLSSTEEQPHLHPDCRFNDAGPTLEGRPPGGNIALHQLGRIARGLRGERLVPEMDSEVALAMNDEDGAASVSGDQDDVALVTVPDDSSTAVRQAVRNRSSQQLDGAGDSASSSDGDERQIEKSYGQQMREQGEDGMLVGEIGERDAGVRNGGNIPKVKALASKESKKEKRKLAQASTHAAGDADAQKDKKKRKKKKHRHEDRSG